MIVAGVDGCRCGWIMVKWNGNAYSYGIYNNIGELLKDNKDLKRILIDNPIGLASAKTKRTVEKKMRRELKYRHSTVFNPPCREAVYELNDDAARKINIKIENKSLSVQSLNIRNKIRELDELLRTQNSFSIGESHPEVCFKYLNDGATLLSNKSNESGMTERLEVLSDFDKNIDKLFKKVSKETLRKHVKKDDIIDAICLCLVNKLGGETKLNYIIDENNKDDYGIEMKIAYYKPTLA
jgi:predicted RNase H-like nuclease